MTTFYRFVPALVLAVPLLSGCGSLPSHPTAQAADHVRSGVDWGPITLHSGEVWQLNNPGSGAPRETLTFTLGTHRAAEISLYASAFGTLVNTTITGHIPSQGAITIRGAVPEASAFGSPSNHRLLLVLDPKSAHTIWVTQHIHGDNLNTFTQLSFHPNRV